MASFASSDSTTPQHQRVISRVRLDAADLAFALVLLLGFVLVLVETRRLSFFGDEWDFVVQRRGMSPDVLLGPHGPHLYLLPILVYKVVLQVFGGDSYVPFRVLAAVNLVLLAGVLGAVCRSFWGKWWGLAPVLLLVTLGPGAVTLLWPFQVGYALPVASGVVALVAAAHGGRSADIVSCGALVLAIASGTAGIGFLVGTAVILAIRGDWLPRLWVVAVPAFLYGLWYLNYGHEASETNLSLWKTSLSYSFQALSATLAPLVGLSSVSPSLGVLDATFGVPITVAMVVAVTAACWRGWRPPALFWGSAATLVVLFVAASLSNWGPYSRPPGDPRYLSTNAVLVLLCLCSALPRPRLAGLGAIVACAVLAIVAATNGAQFSQQRERLAAATSASKAELGAVLILRNTVAPEFNPAVSGDPAAVITNIQSARAFYDAFDSFGIDVDSPSELAVTKEVDRQRADGMLARGGVTFSAGAIGGRVAPTAPLALSGAASADSRCLVVGSAPLVFRARPGTYELAAAKLAMDVSGGRFGDAYSARIGSVPPSTSAVITVNGDAAPETPWRIQTTGTGGRICRVAT
jgi:hypothetical protein